MAMSVLGGGSAVRRRESGAEEGEWAYSDNTVSYYHNTTYTQQPHATITTTTRY